jgi:hypothetical protein
MGAATCIKRIADNAFIPFDPANADYAEYLKWLEEGNEPLPADSAPVPAPDTEALRKTAYREESDPLFFKWQRGEATQAEWLAAVNAIKARYPDLQQSF